MEARSIYEKSVAVVRVKPKVQKIQTGDADYMVPGMCIQVHVGSLFGNAIYYTPPSIIYINPVSYTHLTLPTIYSV